MGLDMYLSRKRYIGGNYEWNKVTGIVDIYRNGKQVPVSLNKIVNIEEDAGYWRKANAIHKWFVDNVQEGVDDCKEYYVPEEKLKELLSICKEISKNHDKAKELLPTQAGFFFGSTDYDEWYFKNIDDTIKIIENVFKDNDYSDIYYQSSW